VLKDALVEQHSVKTQVILLLLQLQLLLLAVFIARQQAVHAERDIVTANPSVCPFVC